MRDLCERIVDGRLQLDAIESLDDEAVIERLTEVKGFGRWTAEMFLMFRLHRPDVLPVDDLGHRQRRAAAVQAAEASRREETADARRTLATVSVGCELVSLAILEVDDLTI